MSIPRSIAATLLMAILVTPATAQQTATVTGRVTDAGTMAPIENVQVSIERTEFGVLTNSQGNFVILNVPQGRYTLRATMIGYELFVQEFTITSAGTVEVNVQLEQVALELDEIVVTATGEQRRRELGHAVSVIGADLVDTAPVSTLSEVLGSGRAAGVTVLANEGTPGAGARIRIRGLSSASLSNDPLLYVDGVRVTERGPALGPYVGGGSPSFLNDLNPEEIESIEIVKGPSAATLYGTQAANGVIRVTTKKGRAGPTRWNVYSEVGGIQDATEYPAMYFSRATGGGSCLPWQQAAGACTIDQLFVRDLVNEDDFTFLRTAVRQQHGVQVRGGSDRTWYFLSGEWENTAGTIVMPESERQFIVESRGLGGIGDIPDEQLNPSNQDKTALRANLGAALGDDATVDISMGFTATNTLIPQTGDNLEGVIGAAFLGTANPDVPIPWGFARPAYGLSNTTARKSDHFTPSGRIHWTPTDWLDVRFTGGLDYVGFRDEALVRNGEACPFCGQDQGARTIDRYTAHKYTAEFGASSSNTLTSSITSRTSVGVQFIKDITRVSFNQGLQLPPGAETFSGAAVKNSSEQTTEFRTLGSYIEQQFGWRDRLFLTGAVRVDQNSAFGEDNRSATYPKVSGSYVVIEPSGGWLSELRVRGAYGQSGQQPTLLAAQTFLTPVNSALFLEGLVPAVTLGGLGNTKVKPERSREFEAGFDAGFFSNRMNLNVTLYDKETTDALVQRELPGSVGAVQFRLENIGIVTNKGIEVSFNSNVIQSNFLNWDVGVEVAANRNRLEELAPGVPPLTGFGFRNQPGFPLFGNWWPSMESYNDANGDGLISPDEVVVSDTATFNGATVPSHTIGVNTDVYLLNNQLRLTAVVDYKGGYVSHNINGLFSCAFIQNCRELNDPNATLEEQAKAVVGPRAFGAWAEDATHARLREVSLSYTLPSNWLSGLQVSQATVTLTGRNLAIWKKEFTSWDPEISTPSGLAGDAAAYNFVQLAQPRMFTLRVNFGF